MINQEEYEMLTELGDKWKWIARDGFKGKLNVYNVRPTRSYFKNWWLTSKWLGRSKTILPYFFPFIQWVDSEPYFIPDLIKEYEEMKKDKEWLKEKVETYFSNWWSNPNTYTTHDLMDSVKHLINQLDEPEVLSQKWISEKSIDTHVDTVNGDIQVTFILDDLENLIVPKKELPVIPRFVADWIEENKKQNKSIVFAICYIYDENKIGGLPAEKENKIFQWMESSDNDEVFVRAWLDGYEVEKEQRYYALIKGHELVSGDESGYWTVDGDDFYIYNNWYDHSEYKPTKLTKYDWSNLGINEDNADFVKAEVVEE